MTSSSLYLASNSDYVKSSSTILPAITGSNAASACGFVYISSGEVSTYVGGVGKYPSMDVTVGSTTAHVYFNYTSSSYSVTIPSVAASTWYFWAVTAVSGGQVYFYWGQVGALPTQYNVTSSAGTSGAVDSVVFNQITTGSSYAASQRYFTTTALTQQQVNEEALSLVPVNTYFCTFNFFAPASGTLTALLTDTVSGSTVLSNTGGAYSTATSPALIMTAPSALYIPSASVDYVISSSTILPAIVSGHSASACGFCNANVIGAGSFNNVDGQFYPTIYNTSSTAFSIYFNGSSNSVTVPTIKPNIWYFYAVTATYGGQVYFYWGRVGTTPIRYNVTTGGATGSGGDYVNYQSSSNNYTFWASCRYWTNTLLTQAQINAEAASLTPVNTSGLSYQFFATTSTSLQGLLTDTVGGSVSLLNNGCLGGQNPPSTKGSLLTVASGATVVSSSKILPAITSGNSATCSGFVYTVSPETAYTIYNKNNTSGYCYPSIFNNSSTSLTVTFNQSSNNITVPIIAANTWYFFAVTATYGGQVYLYWGQAGSTPPTQYNVTSSGGTASGTDYVQAYSSIIGSYYSSLRYWTTTALTQAQVNQEAASIMPVNNTGLTYHFLAPYSTSIAGLSNDVMGSGYTLTSSNCQWAENVTIAQSINPNNAMAMLMSRVK